MHICKAFVLLVCSGLLVSDFTASHVVGSDAHTPVKKRPITVDDAIAMAQWTQRVFYSGDGKRFALVLRKANSKTNENCYSLYVFETSTVFSSPDRRPVLSLSSSSNRDAITSIAWLSDNKTITFLGEKTGHSSQVYAFDVTTRHLTRLTNSVGPVVAFTTTPDDKTVIYVSEESGKKEDTEEISRHEKIDGLSSLQDSFGGGTTKRKLFVKKSGGPAFGIEVNGTLLPDYLSVSADGRYGLAERKLSAENLPPEWAAYKFPEDKRLHTFFHASWGSTPFKEYVLLDLASHSTKELLNAPVLLSVPLGWRGHSVFLANTYLPLVSNAPESGSMMTYCAQVQVPSLQFEKVAQDICSQWKATQQIRVQEQQDLNTPPKLFAVDSVTKRSAQLLDPNPQFDDLEFGKVETVVWKVKGIELTGGLYFPRGYSSRERYPLVIQTHGFEDATFSMDGRSEWSSGFAARPLAAHGFIVLQAYDFRNSSDHDRVMADRSLGATEAESFKNFAAAAYGTAIDYLNERGLIDQARVGISGFSRTVCFVLFALTHSEHRFAAASLTDGIDCSYFSYLAFPERPDDTDNLNGGVSPFSRSGLLRWFDAAPGFSLARIEAPVRLVAIGPAAILEEWEWLVGLRLQNKPVELVEIPKGVHILHKPWDRKIAMEGLVDWYRFWLKDEEDPSAEKVQQYARWRRMRPKS